MLALSDSTVIERLVDLDGVARLDHQFDHFHFLEVADIRDLNFHNAHSMTPFLFVFCEERD